jgi:hypothetical protein
MQNHHSYMKTTLVLAFCLALPLFAGQPAPAPKIPAAPANPKTAEVLNQKDIHAAYNEGDFDKVTALIDAFNRANKTCSRADSIFIAKHLAVVYSANPQSREKGKYYMYRLLEMMPSAELVDMFVSDEIDRIFDKVRREFVARQKAFGVDSAQISSPEKASTGSAASASAAAAPAVKPAAAPGPGPSGEFLAAAKEDKQPYWKRNGFWIAGSVGLVVAGTAAYFIYTQDKPTGRTIVIPSGTSAQK